MGLWHPQRPAYSTCFQVGSAGHSALPSVGAPGETWCQPEEAVLAREELQGIPSLPAFPMGRGADRACPGCIWVPFSIGTVPHSQPWSVLGCVKGTGVPAHILWVQGGRKGLAWGMKG